VASARIALFAVASLLLCAVLSAQEPPPNPAVISPNARLMAARSIFIEHAGGILPNDVIGDAFQGWGRYTVVGDPADADIIVSIEAPTSDSGVTVADGRRSSTVASAQVTQIRLRILDAHDRVVLWSSSEQPKSSIKEKTREDNVVEASLRLFRRFRTLVEPEPAP
jgi:hypothetical protein